MAETLERADNLSTPSVGEQQPGIKPDAAPSLRVLPPARVCVVRKRRSTANSLHPKVLVMDGHPMVREWVGVLIRAEGDLKYAGHGTDLAETASLVARNNANLVLLEIANDVHLGLKIIRSLREKFPKLRMLVFSSCDEVAHFAPAFRAGANGFVSKATSGQELLRAIRLVLDDDVYLSKEVIGHLVKGFCDTMAAPKTGPCALLSERELQVFAFIGEGLRPTEIAHRISLSVKTVESYLTRIREKLQLRDARALFQDAVRWSKTRDRAFEN
jgi:DNA-binding NarL/FixJ family response regulator